MNCKKGDMAIVVRTGPATQWALGCIVVCAERAPDVSGNSDAWVIDVPLMRRLPNGEKICWSAIADQYLRPLRDPGNACNETLNWLPVSKTLAT